MPYDAELAEEICDIIACSSDPLKQILASDARYPSPATFSKWLRNNDEFEAAYLRAKAFQADFMAEEMLAIADRRDLEAHDKRVMVDTRKWLMAKAKPRRFGDQLDITSKGEALAAPVLNQVTIDQRVQTIMLLARERAEAAKLLE